MKIKQHRFLIILCLAAFGPCLSALQAQSQEAVTRTEYEALAAKVAQLEARLAGVQTQQLDSITQEVLASMPVSTTSQASPSLIENVVAAVKQREQEVNFPWMDSAKWAPLRMGMSPEEVIAQLGEPTLDEPSLNRRIDFVYTYQGRRPTTNQRVEGKVRFYKGEAIDIERPVLD
jgi:outer membrane protein assembly factor BamE (lipoprotein component of BamABCDE complex)